MPAAALVALLMPAALQAQASDTAALRRTLAGVSAGTPVRVELGANRFIAPVAGIMADGFALRDTAGASRAIRFQDVSRLWVRKRAIGAGMAVGGVAGAGTGVFFGMLASGLCDSGDCPSVGQGAVVGGLLGGLLGGALGAVIGAAIPRWDLAWSNPARDRSRQQRTTTVNMPAPGQDPALERNRVGELTTLTVVGYGGFPSDSGLPDQGFMFGATAALGLRMGRVALGPELAMLLLGDNENWSLRGTARIDLTDTRRSKPVPYVVAGLGGTFWDLGDFEPSLLTATLGLGVTLGARERVEVLWHPAVQNVSVYAGGNPVGKPALVTIAAGYRFVW